MTAMRLGRVRMQGKTALAMRRIVELARRGSRPPKPHPKGAMNSPARSVAPLADSAAIGCASRLADRAN